MKTRTVYGKPACFERMYALSEDEMAERCLGCGAFNDCKDIGYGNDEIPASVRIPAEPARDFEYTVRW